MHKIIRKEELAKDTTQITIQAEAIAAKARAGQFVAVIVDETGERIPLTIADWDAQAGTITLIFQQVGYTTRKLASLAVGDPVAHILGPLGHPTEVKMFGTVVCVGGGVGVAEVYPVSRAFSQAGNNVIGIIGAREKSLLILEGRMRSVCNQLRVVTDDGSYGTKGLVTDALKEIFDTPDKSAHTNPDLVYAIGPVPMMKAVAECTRPLGIKTIVSINPIMVDATGMCGACRCTVGGKTVFGCVDGPDFDGHAVDFDELQKRLGFFKEQERGLK
jgi:ferredoxin/flavodoxin---NADP+ reductase